jgi:hypothetical protein
MSILLCRFSLTGESKGHSYILDIQPNSYGPIPLGYTCSGMGVVRCMSHSFNSFN